VIAKSYGMSPLIERNELAALVSAPPFGYGRAFVRGRLFDTDPPQFEINL
jgi:hypothetical protein